MARALSGEVANLIGIALLLATKVRANEELLPYGLCKLLRS